MRLPGIQYSTGVASLAKLSPNVPLAEAEAFNRAIGSIGKAAQTIMAAENAVDTATTAAQFQTVMAEINAQTSSRKAYYYKDLDELGIQYPEKYGPGKVEVVPAYLVSVDVYRALANKAYQNATYQVPQEAREAISKVYGRLYEKGITGVMTFAVNEAAQQQRIRVNDAFEQNVRAGNATAAMTVAETARKTGVWSAEQYEQNVSKLPQRISMNQYLMALDNNDDVQMLETLQNNVIQDPSLDFASRNQLYKQYDSKIAKLEQKKLKDMEEQKDRMSYEVYVATSSEILQYGPVPWDQLAEITSGIERVDGKALITLNRLAQDKGNTTDPQAHMDLTVMINNIPLPKEGTTIFDRKEAAINALMEAAGVDPATGERVGPSKLSTSDFNAMWNRVKQMGEYTVSDRNVNLVADNIWRLLIGGSKDMVTKFMGNGPEIINASKAEMDLYKAALEFGPGFDPYSWWDKNQERYLLEAIRSNQKDLDSSLLSNYIIKSQSGSIDIDKTMKAIAAKQKAGVISVDKESIVEFEKSLERRNRIVEMYRAGKRVGE